MINTENYYLETFGVSRSLMEELAAEGLRTGGDYSDLFFESTWGSSLMFKDGEVTYGGFNVDYGVGIRVLKGEKTGYAYSESTSRDAMISAARAAGAIAGSSRSDAAPARILTDARDHGSPYVKSDSNGGRPVRKFFTGVPNPAADRYPVLNDWRVCPTTDQAAFLSKLAGAVMQKDTRIVKVIATLSSQMSDYLMFNSFGELKYDTRPLATVAVSVIFKQGDDMESKAASRSWRTGSEMLSDELISEISALAVKGIDEKFEARRPKGGKMQVVMGAGASGILLHEAMGHAFEADFNRKGQSIFSDRMGKRICPKGISIVDDATLRANRGSLNFDDEGVPGQRTMMVEDGILTSYLHDRISARFYGVTPTGNGRRESFRYEPLPRMRATYMEGGDSDPQDIIASVKKGIYVDDFTNGQVKIGEGDFTFYVNSGFLIENGRKTMPVKDINIIGNGPQALADIIAVGNDPVVDKGAWTCGKGQSVPVSCGIPTVLVNGLTVGGEQ
ncbi:MAG: TldD/PmbA family protein [Bacteroidales bacterium]|nr:TldD/PmbA family protein [Bacteroidales bacterium]